MGYGTQQKNKKRKQKEENEETDKTDNVGKGCTEEVEKEEANESAPEKET